jgi:hypothetical protein
VTSASIGFDSRPGQGCVVCAESYASIGRIDEELGISVEAQESIYRCSACDTCWMGVGPHGATAVSADEAARLLPDVPVALQSQLPDRMIIGPIADRPRSRDGRLLIMAGMDQRGTWSGSPVASRVGTLAALALVLDAVHDRTADGEQYEFQRVHRTDGAGNLHVGYGLKLDARIDLDLVAERAVFPPKIRGELSPEPAPAVDVGGHQAVGPGSLSIAGSVPDGFSMLTTAPFVPVSIEESPIEWAGPWR